MKNILLLALLSFALLNPINSQSLLKTFDQEANQYVKKKKNKGLVVGYFSEGEQHFKSYGAQSEIDKSLPSATQIFELGAVTELFTTALMMQLEKEQLLDPTDCIAGSMEEGFVIPNYLPLKCTDMNIWAPMLNDQPMNRQVRSCFPDPLAFPECITFCQLATHNSGLRFPFKYRYMWEPFEKVSKRKSLEKTSKKSFLKQIKNTNVYSKPGTYYSYSVNGMSLLGLALSEVKDEPFESLVNQYLLEPLDLKNTFFNETSAQEIQIIQGHDSKGRPVGLQDMDARIPALGLKSSPKDMLQFLNYQLDNKHFMSDLFYEQRQGRVETGFRLEGDKVFQGYGWKLISLDPTNKDEVTYWISGSTDGYNVFLAFDTTNKTAVVLFSNSENSVRDLGFQLVKALSEKTIASSVTALDLK